MGRRQRVQHAEDIFFLTNKCFQTRFFLTPTPEVNELILASLARAMKRYPHVQIFAFVAMNNHWHAIARGPERMLSKFCCLFQSLLAKAVNEQIDRKGTFFKERYRPEKILDDNALDAMFAYLTLNPVKSNLVNDASEWPGISSYGALFHGEQLHGEWTDCTELRRLRRKAPSTPPSAARASHPIVFTPLPRLADKTEDDRREALRAIVEAGRAQISPHILNAKPVGAAQVVAWSPFRRAGEDDDAAQKKARMEREKKPQPRCHSDCSKRARAYWQHYRTTVRAYQEASASWRTGRRNVVFPSGTFPPGISRPVP